MFDDRPGQPHSVYVTRLARSGTRTVKWLSGGLRAWIDALDLDRDDLLAALL
jgi:hypothetical protein